MLAQFLGTNALKTAFLKFPTLETLAIARPCNLLILATQTTIKKELYKHPSFVSIVPNEQEQVLVNQIIDRVEQNKVLEEDAVNLTGLIRKMQERAIFDGVVLGCTELSVLFERYPQHFLNSELHVSIFDTTSILTQSLVKSAFET